MKRKLGLDRLLDRQAVTPLLEGFAALLGPGVSLSVVDVEGRQVAGYGAADETEFLELWNRVQEQGRFVSRAGDLAARPLAVADEPAGMLVVVGRLPPNLDDVVSSLTHTLETLANEAAAKRAIAQETLDRYREINVLYNITETLGACLDLEEVTRLVLDESIKLIKNRLGAVLLVDPMRSEKRLSPDELTLAAAVRPDAQTDAILHQALPLAVQVIQSGKPRIVNDFQPQGLSPTPVVCAPLRFQEEVLGAILLAAKEDGSDFAAADERLLFTLATQAASAIENARLFESVKRQRDEIATIKNYMDNIFASVASGVITTDMDNNITTFNRAAESILSLPARAVLNRSYRDVLTFLNDTPLPTLIENVRERGDTHIDYEVSSQLPDRGQVHLSMSLSRLRGSSQEPLGVTIVMDDVTEKKQFEQERRMVRRYLPSELVDSLPALDELKLRGERQTITTLFADIRGFTSFSEIHEPETVVQVINRYFALVADAVGEHHGIIDKYLGDAVMVVFNTPLLAHEDHAWEAVQAAWELKQAIKQYHPQVAPELRMDLGIGICTGDAVVGNVGTEARMEYTAIGDAVNVAKRLQESAAAGQILMSRSTWKRVRNRVRATALVPVTLKGRRATTEAFQLDALIG